MIFYIYTIIILQNIKNSKDPFSLKLLDSFLKDITSRVYHELAYDALTYIKFNSIENLDAISLFGRIERVEHWDDVTIAENHVINF